MMRAPMESVGSSGESRLHAVGVDVSGALNLVGWLVAYLSPAFLFPIALAIGYGDPVWPFAVAGAATLAFGYGLERLTSGRERIGSREGYLVVALIWLLIAVFGAIPYLLAEPQLSNPVDAVFESMSGFSTTGSSVLTDIEALDPSMLMWRQFTTWIGGVGIIVLFLAVLPRLRVGGRQALFRTEAAGPELGFAETIRESARRFVVLYVAITALAALVLALLGWTGVDPRMDLFRAVAHAFATIATAGFSTEARSIEPFAPATQWVIVVFMVVAGTSFALMYAGIVRRRPRVFARDEEFRVYLALLAIASALVVVELADAGIFEGGDAVRHGVFNVVTMMTTTGFASADFNQWTALTTVVLFGVTLISASAGSTSGSIKLVRHIVIAKLLQRELDQTLHPHRVAPLRVNAAVVDERALRAVIVFVFLYLGVLVAGAVVILVDCSLRGIPLGSFEALAAASTTLGGVGPGLGFAGPMGNFAPFSDFSKVVLTALMYLGRLEIIPVLVIFTRSHWRA
jgi:trk system potassium uptake protein TrkH